MQACSGMMKAALGCWHVVRCRASRLCSNARQGQAPTALHGGALTVCITLQPRPEQPPDAAQGGTRPELL